MPYIPHTQAQVKEMLNAIGVDSINDLFREIPSELKKNTFSKIPPGINEMQANTLANNFCQNITNGICFLGAGAYNHHIPSAVWAIASRGEFLTAYTPYQAEASQGTLQLIYEFQSMLCALTGLDAANASLYDGASALAEAVLMAKRLQKKSRSNKVLLPDNLHKSYIDTVRTIVSAQDIEIELVPFSNDTGTTLASTIEAYQDYFAIVIAQPNFFGMLEDADTLTDIAHAKNALVIACVNPMSLALLKPPGEWGKTGADICVGEGQPLGVPLASGGPYFGFMTTKMANVRQMPGRIVGKTTDKSGNLGFSLTLQAREQHIRRSKATSNICTNQGLLVTAATIYMSLLGPNGLKNVAINSHNNLIKLKNKIKDIPGVHIKFTGSRFHEMLIELPLDASLVIKAMMQDGINPGVLVNDFYQDMQNSLLVCTTEVITDEDIQAYYNSLLRVLAC